MRIARTRFVRPLWRTRGSIGQGPSVVDVPSASPITAPARTGLGRRRPTGEPPALPRRVSRSTPLYVVLLAFVIGLWVVLLIPAGARVVTRVDNALIGTLEPVRNALLDDVMLAIHAFGSEWTFRLIAWPTLIIVLALRRFQRLVVLLGATLVVVALNAQMSAVIGRMRPIDLDAVASWVGYSHPSVPVAGLALALAGALYTLAPAGPWRNRGAWVAAAAVAMLVVSRVYLAVDHPTDALAGAITGVAIPVIAFRLLTPDEIMPVSYRRGRRAHLDIRGRRTDAIVAALGAQLGLAVVDVEPFAEAGSAGSTPLRIRVVEPSGRERVVFGKLYANVHLRSDRWYKLARAVMYGRLEDERSFNTVRRLVEYEDHMLRVARDAGIPTVEPYGFAEITPEREYLLLTEFLDDAQPIGAANVDDTVIAEALSTVRSMWSAGLAHRDIKPANVLVRDDHVVLIDFAFAAMRPSPWREAVDLANMMFTLALFSSPTVVYEHATRFFSPDEVAEALAASRSVTIPTQLRSMLKRDGRDIASAFRELAPRRPSVSIQRWTVRRVALTAGVVVSAFVAVLLVAGYLNVAGLL